MAAYAALLIEQSHSNTTKRARELHVNTEYVARIVKGKLSMIFSIGLWLQFLQLNKIGPDCALRCLAELTNSCYNLKIMSFFVESSHRLSIAKQNHRWTFRIGIP
jgi:hypothetical protein